MAPLDDAPNIPKAIRPFLEKIFWNDEKKILEWFMTENIGFHGLSPMELVAMNRTSDVVGFLRFHLDDVQIFRG